MSFNETSPGLAFNSQNSLYSKWTFKHEGELRIHDIDTISENIDHLINAYPQLNKCIVRQSVDLFPEQEAFVWFNVYCVPGDGEWFKQDEQVYVENIFSVCLYVCS